MSNSWNNLKINMRSSIGRRETAAHRHLVKPESHLGRGIGDRGKWPECRMHRSVASWNAGQQNALFQIERQWEGDDPDRRFDIRRRYYSVSCHVFRRQRTDFRSHISSGREQNAGRVGTCQGYAGEKGVKYKLIFFITKFFCSD